MHLRSPFVPKMRSESMSAHWPLYMKASRGLLSETYYVLMSQLSKMQIYRWVAVKKLNIDPWIF